MSNANTIQQRLQDLISTIPNLTSDEISAVNSACSLIDELTVKRDDFAYRYETASKLTTSALDALSKALTERDALMAAAKLALDALENIPQADSDCDEETQQDDDAIQEAIEALKKAGVTP